MNIDCEIGIRGDTCQCLALSLGCRQAWGRYRGATVACRHSSALKAATFPLYLPGEACLPFTGLIFLLEPLTIYSLLPPPLLPPPGTVPSLISSSVRVIPSVWLCLSSSFFPSLLVLTVCHSFSLTFTVTLSSTHGFDYQEVNNLDSRYIIKWFTWHHAEQEAVLAREGTRLIMCSNTCLTSNVCYFSVSVCASGLNTQP